MLRKGMFLADRYEIIESIGAGGMSDVYKAKCHKLNRYVAIKVMKDEFSQDKNFISKFRIEAQSAAGLTHPNIVSVYDVGDENGIYYFVMELVEGITLKKYIEKKGRLSSKEAVSIAIQIAQGMEAAHNHHIVHRDIKPQNIIISKEGKVKVTDFGIARAASSQTINSSAMGSVHYISPEQARGGYSDEKSDIYSFGITLYEMLTGSVPFDGDSTVSVAVQHIQDEIMAPSMIVSDIPVSVDKIVTKCTQKKIDRRYQNASELIADLKKSLVMPDVDFVKIGNSYDMESDSLASSNNRYNAVRELEDEAELKEEEEDILLADDGEFTDEDITFIEEEEPEEEYEEDDEYDDDDYYDDEKDDKVGNIMKWVGFGLAGVIVLITVVMVVKLASMAVGQQPSVENKTEIATQNITEANVEKVKVPSVIGMKEEEAISALENAYLKCKTSRQPSSTVAEGYVISQSQKADSRIAKNSTITIAISSGSDSATMVNVVGMTEEEAVELIVNSGFSTPTVDYSFSDTVEQGHVISQTPGARASAKPSQKVKIVVSRGKESKMVTMPNVVNMSETQARQTLDALGLNVKLSQTPVLSATIPYGNVAAQNYSAGKEVAEGTTIELTMSIGLGTTTVTVPATVTATN